MTDKHIQPEASKRKLVFEASGLFYISLFIFPFILFVRPLLKGEALFWGVPALQFIPWRALAWEQVRQGILPLWNPYNGMGAPLLANYQLALFYPPGWLIYSFAALGGVPWMAWAHTLLVVLHLAWAGLGLARLLAWLDVKPLGQVIGGLSFALGGYFTARTGFFSMIWAGAWLPWILLYVGRLTRSERFFSRASFWLTICLAMQWLAGHAQLAWYSVLLGAGWGAYWGWQAGRARGWLVTWLRYALTGVLGLVLAAVQLLPTAEYMLNSYRSTAVDYETAMTYSFWGWRLLTLFAPNLFGNPGTGNYWGYAAFWEDALYFGLLPLLLALSTLGAISKPFGRKPASPHSGLIRFLWVWVFLSILLGLGKNTPVFPFLYQHIPTFSLFNAPARLLIWAAFSFSVLAGLGAETWQRPQGKALYWTRLATAGGAAIASGSFMAWIFLQNVKTTFIQAFAFLALWALGAGLLTLFKPVLGASQRRKTIWNILTIIFVGADLLLAGWYSAPTLPIRFYEAAGQVNGVFSHRIYMSKEDEYLWKYKRFLRFQDFSALEDWGMMRNLRLPNLNILDHISSANNFDPLSPARTMAWMESLEEQSPLVRRTWLAMMDVSEDYYRSRWALDGYAIAPVEGAARVRWFACAMPAHGASQALKKWSELAEPASNGDIPDVVVIENAGSTPLCHSHGNGRVEIVETQPNRVRLLSRGDEGWVLLAEPYYPGWSARIDGEETHIYPANGLFRAVQVPEGEHEIEFVYQPLSFIVGALLSGIGLLGLVIWGFRRWRSSQG